MFQSTPSACVLRTKHDSIQGVNCAGPKQPEVVRDPGGSKAWSCSAPSNSDDFEPTFLSGDGHFPPCRPARTFLLIAK